MLKNNLKSGIKKLLFPAIILAGNGVFAAGRFEAIKPAAAKYFFVLVVLTVFFIILYIGLSLYNKFFVSDVIKNANLDKISLKSPTDAEDAVAKFIYRNRLK